MRSPLALALAALALVAATRAQAQPQGSPSRNEQIVMFKHDMPAADRRKLVEATGFKVLGEMPFIDAILAEAPAYLPTQINLLRGHPAFEALEDNSYRKWIDFIAPGFDTPAAGGPAAAVREIVGQAGKLKEPKAPAEPMEGGEQDANPPAAPTNERPWGIDRVHAPQAWSKTQGDGVKVGIIDTGIDMDHPDLKANYAGGFNFVDPAATPFDDQGHGTHVSGTIAAARGNGGVAGVAPMAKLYAIKVLDAYGGASPSTIIEGIQWAAENGMQVVNMSLGGPSSAAMKKAVKAAVTAGVTVVAAAGNDPEAPVAAPAMYPESIAVSASTKEDALAFFSTTGPEVDFIGPGHEVWSDSPGRKLAMHSGTSMACPHVTGLAALAVSLGASTPAAVRSMLERAAEPIPGLSASQQGAGMPMADKLGR